MIKPFTHIFKDDGSTASSKRRQALVLSATVIIIAVIGFIIFGLPGGDKKVPFPAEGIAKGKIKISGVTEGAKAESRWLQEAEVKLQKLDKLAEENTKLQAEMIELKKQAAEAKVKQSEEIDHKAVVDGYYQELTKLEDRLRDIESQKPIPGKQFTANPQKESQAPGKSPYGAENVVNMVEQTHSNNMISVDFKLDDSEDSEDDDSNVFDTGEYLPAGSYVSAVVISGVDASVGISSQGDPRPVLFRVSGEAVSAISDEEETQKIDIKGCTVTGAASGDLSSEKVFVRLLKMTCSRESGTVIETEVHGYVTAVGKAGVRGPVVSREGDLVAKSFIAGLAGGVGSEVAQSLTTPATVVGGVATQTPNIRDIAGQGVGKGLQSSADRLADYLIKRAEQYQPVITMSAGIEVELVFNDGVYIDGKKRSSKKAEVKKNG